MLAMKILKREKLERVCEKILSAAGVESDEAIVVAESLVESNLLGIDSHGVLRIPDYVRKIKKGTIKLGTKISVIKETETSALIDGAFGFGQVVARKATQIAVEKAKSSGIGVVGLIKSNHIGRLGEYTSNIAENGMIGLGFCNSVPVVAPFGGSMRRLGTNPFSVAFSSNKYPFLLDYATSTVAEGKLRQKYFSKQEIPLGWIIDGNGNPSTNPADYYDGKGAMLPFGEYKGYALSMVVDTLGGILTAAHFSSHKEFVEGNNVMLIAINISSFRPLDEFKAEVDQYFQVLKSTPPAQGFSEVMIPGEIEYKTKEKREKRESPLAKKFGLALWIPPRN